MAPAMAGTKRIGILTGGGDVPGLNAVIKSVVYRATEVGLRRPRHPPRLGGPDPRPARARRRPRLPPAARPHEHPDHRPDRRHDPAHLADEPAQDARRRPAALAGRRRSRAATRRPTGPLRPDAARARAPRGARASTSSSPSAATTRCRYSQVLVNAGVPLVAIPKTMDNDVQGTEYCIGFSTAITRAKEAINRQRTTLGSHERIGVFRIFGRDAGFSALYTAYVTSAPLRDPRGTRTTSTRSPRSSPPTTRPTRATTRSSSRPRARSGRARRWPTSARPTRSGTATRPTSARRWPPSFGRGPASRRSPRS